MMSFFQILQNLGICFGVYIFIMLFPWLFAIFSNKHLEINNLDDMPKYKFRSKSYSYNIDLSSEIYATPDFFKSEFPQIDEKTGLIIDKMSDNTNKKTVSAEKYSEKSNYSLEKLNEILDNDPSDFEALLFSGIGLSSESMHTAALERFKKAYALKPESIDVIYRLARTHYKLKNYETMLPLYDKLLNQEPEKHLYLKQFGTLLLTLGRHEQASEILKRAIKVREKDPYAYVMLGHNYRAMGNIIESRELFDKALELQPKSFDANLQLAISYEKIGDFDSAIRNWKHVLKIDENSARAKMGIARSYYRNREYGKAYELFWEFLEKKCQRYGYEAGVYCVNISVNYYGDLNEIIRSCSTVIANFNQKLIESKNGHIPITQMALALSKKGDFDFSIRLIKKYKEIFPNLAEYFLLSAQINLKSNNFENYFNFIQKAFSFIDIRNNCFNSTRDLITVDSLFSTSLERIEGPLVSVIMTVYKNNGLLMQAIESVLNQTYHNLELIIVDDCSPDDVIELIQKRYHGNKRVKIIQMEKNGGTYIAKNYGMKISNGEFIAFHDSDDWMHPRKLEIQIGHLLSDENLVAVFSNYYRMDEKGNIIFKGIGAVRPACISLVMRRNEVLNKIGYFDSVRIAADSEYEYRLEKVFGLEKILYLENPYLIASVRSDSLSQGGKFAVGWSGISGVRLDYRKSYSKWHNSAEFKQDPYIPINQENRKFNAPDETIA